VYVPRIPPAAAHAARFEAAARAAKEKDNTDEHNKHHYDTESDSGTATLN